MRMGFTAVPTWQLVLNVAVLILSALAALWLAGRTFRLGMLQYGQRLSLRQILGVRKTPASKPLAANQASGGRTS
jgi:ABC-2 type transport system permease protein